MEQLAAYVRDVYEVRLNLLDRGFKRAAEILDQLPKAQVEAIIGSAFSVQYARDKSPAKRPMCLWQKVRMELGLSPDEFAKMVSKFHATDVSAQVKDWRVARDEFMQGRLTSANYRDWKKGGLNIPDIESEFPPQPELQKITHEDICLIESTRPHREKRKPGSVEVYERFFRHQTGFKLTWEELLAPLGDRDPRAQRIPADQQKKRWKAPETPIRDGHYCFAALADLDDRPAQDVHCEIENIQNCEKQI